MLKAVLSRVKAALEVICDGLMGESGHSCHMAVIELDVETKIGR